MVYVVLLNAFDFDLYFYIFEKNKKKAKPIYIYLIYFNLLFLLRAKKVSVFKGIKIFIARKIDVYSKKNRCI
ncbi:hypothetical protein D5676_14400 [Enterococcus faecalis]|nr:hypothetical protein [Enterococcus faecalis]EGO9031939.1 hypothetical protein [Enterococcus faecalis]EGO9034742.1 hypothetical protein [Enterococcus faecalis]